MSLWDWETNHCQEGETTASRVILVHYHLHSSSQICLSAAKRYIELYNINQDNGLMDRYIRTITMLLSPLKIGLLHS